MKSDQRRRDQTAENEPAHAPHDVIATPSNSASHSDPNAGVSDPTDGRPINQWLSRYPKEARGQIFFEGAYLLLLLLICYIALFKTWRGDLASMFSLSAEQAIDMKKYVYYSASGMLGGVTFGMKYFYRVIARGWWNQDRLIWRIKAPIVSMTVGFILGAMTEASMVSSQSSRSGCSIIAIGFLAGYFADEAVSKMYEVATVIFGKSKNSTD